MLTSTLNPSLHDDVIFSPLHATNRSTKSMMLAFSAPATSLRRPRVNASSLCAHRPCTAQVLPARVRPAVQRKQWFLKIGIVYSSNYGFTEEIADIIEEKLRKVEEDPKYISNISPSDFLQYDTIIVGASWNTNHDDRRSDIELDQFIYCLEDLGLTGHSVAVFGLDDVMGDKRNLNLLFLKISKASVAGTRIRLHTLLIVFAERHKNYFVPTKFEYHNQTTRNKRKYLPKRVRGT